MSLWQLKHKKNDPGGATPVLNWCARELPEMVQQV